MARFLFACIHSPKKVYHAAEKLAKEGKTAEAIAAFEKLREEFPRTWIDRRSQERLKTLREK